MYEALRRFKAADHEIILQPEELEKAQERLDDTIIALSIAFIRYLLPGDLFESVMISFCTILCLKADETGIMEAH